MNANRILVRLPNWTGDVVMATPALRALRATFAGAQITAHVREELAPLLEGSTHIDEILPLQSSQRGVRASWREGRELAARGFDLGICFPDSWSSVLLMRAAEVTEIAGYRRSFREILLHRSVAPLPEWGRHREVARERYLLHLVEALGCQSRGTELELPLRSENEAEVASLLGSAAGSGYVVLAPGAGNGAAKRWPAEQFALTAEKLAKRGQRVVICGAPGEVHLAQQICELASSEILDLTGVIGLGGFKALLAGADLLVCNDAGARHVAAAFGTPSIVLFGPTSMAKTDCNLERVRPLAAEVACRPCRLRECPTDHRCMRRIGVEEIVEQAGALAKEFSRVGAR
ncbi:MAG: lipopolysaccharide heptosyltransferase II [Myxococcota bacterium]|nr:lipopolysaccharide heptosyltransferase II [Myxococcota bacterium]